MCTMWAQRSQNGVTPVIWDYHVVMLEKTPEGFQVWDPDCTTGTTLSCEEWTNANFPLPDPTVRMRVVDSVSFNQNFRSDRRHSNGATQPEWPAISPGEYNLGEYNSVLPGGPGEILNLQTWDHFTGQTKDLLPTA